MKNYNSRKFLLAVIITAAFILFEGAAVVYGFTTGDWSAAIDLAPFLVYTAGVYIAGNVAQDFSPKDKRNEMS